MLPQLTKEANIRVDNNNDLFISFYRDEILLLFSGFAHFFFCKNVYETPRFFANCPPPPTYNPAPRVMGLSTCKQKNLT